MTADSSVFETIYSLSGMPYLEPTPVSEDLICKVIEAATKAPSGGDSQPWLLTGE